MRVLFLCLGLVASGCQTKTEEVPAVFYCPDQGRGCLQLNGQATTRGAPSFPCKGKVREPSFEFPTQKAVGRMVANQVTKERRCD